MKVKLFRILFLFFLFVIIHTNKLQACRCGFGLGDQADEIFLAKCISKKGRVSKLLVFKKWKGNNDFLFEFEYTANCDYYFEKSSSLYLVYARKLPKNPVSYSFYSKDIKFETSICYENIVLGPTASIEAKKKFMEKVMELDSKYAHCNNFYLANSLLTRVHFETIFFFLIISNAYLEFKNRYHYKA